MEKYQYFNNIKFVRDDKTGYYLYSTRRVRLHRYVWSFYNGNIPPLHDIHHKDHDKANNDITNLELIHRKDHASFHSREYYAKNKEKVIANLDAIRPLTKEWHSSESGKEWHRLHYLDVCDKLHKKIKMTCEFCNKEFEGLPNHSKVCSNNCKAARRRRLGLDNISLTCLQCGEKFTKNKYHKNVTCSKGCGRAYNKNKKDTQNSK